MNAYQKYKFPELKLRFLFDVKSGATPSSNIEDSWDGDIYWITPDDLGKLDTREICDTRRKIAENGHLDSGINLAPPNSLVLSKRAPIGLVAITKVESTCNQGCFLLTKKMDIDERFYYYVLIQQKPYLEILGSGSTFLELSSDDLFSIRLPFPDLKIQKIIADYLDHETNHIDSLIEEKEKIVTLLNKKRTALISQIVTCGIDTNVSFKPSGCDYIVDIPAHWSVYRLKYLTNEPLAYGANEAALENNMSWPRYVRITDIKDDGTLRSETFRSLSPDVAHPYLLETGDVLFARSGSVGKSFLYRPEWGDACFAGYLIRFRSNVDMILPEYVHYFTFSNAYWQQVRKGSIQATIQNFSAEKYGDILICLPPIQEQQAIVSHISEFIQREDNLQKDIVRSIELLKKRRAALITAAVTGQINPKEVVT